MDSNDNAEQDSSQEFKPMDRHKMLSCVLEEDEDDESGLKVSEDVKNDDRNLR
jgi:hypothetical protein